MPKKELNESELSDYINRIANGDRTALKQFYDKYRKPIFWFAFSITKNHHLAEDAMQNTFIDIMKCAASVASNIKYPKEWLFTIVKNQSIKLIKKEHWKELENIDDLSEILITYDNLEHITDPIEEIESLKCLDPVELQVVVLYIYGGIKQTEIANILNLPYINVRSKYYCAVKKLKKFYAKKGGKL